MADGEQQQNGITKPITMGVVYDLSTGEVKLSIPKELAHAYVLLKMLQDAIFQQAMNPEPDRKVKTLDEMGVRPIRRLQ